MPDAQVFSCNLEWFNSLPKKVQEGIEFASEVSSLQNLAKVPSARAYSVSEMKNSGVQFYSPNDEEMQQWVEIAGHQRPEWNETKKELAGSIASFDKLLEGANTQSKFYVHDV